MLIRICMLFQMVLAVRLSTVPLTKERSQRCYVCIPNTGSTISDVLHMFPGETHIPLCSQFHPEKTEYIRECPSSIYQGCLTQTNGTHVTKMCTQIGIKDCKMANKIQYCYCKDELCNREEVPTVAPMEEYNEDDEDSSFDGSGYTDDPISRQREASFEDDIKIEVIQYEPTTTMKSVILTATISEDDVMVQASANHFSQPIIIVNLIPCLLLLRYYLY